MKQGSIPEALQGRNHKSMHLYLESISEFVPQEIARRWYSRTCLYKVMSQFLGYFKSGPRRIGGPTLYSMPFNSLPSSVDGWGTGISGKHRDLGGVSFQKGGLKAFKRRTS